MLEPRLSCCSRHHDDYSLKIENLPKAPAQAGQQGARVRVKGSMIDHIVSKGGIAIRLTDERWAHITEEHCELAGLRSEVIETVSYPNRILLGGDGELIAVREVEIGKHLVVVYREQSDDGFIITAFLTRRIRSLEKRRQVWP
jgi:hypothetical protein